MLLSGLNLEKKLSIRFFIDHTLVKCRVSDLYIYTASKKSFTTCLCVWNKTTLNIGSGGGAGARPSNLKNEVIFSYVLGTLYANFQQFPIKWSFRRNSQTKITTFYSTKSENYLRVPFKAHFFLKL